MDKGKSRKGEIHGMKKMSEDFIKRKTEGQQRERVKRERMDEDGRGNCMGNRLSLRGKEKVEKM